MSTSSNDSIFSMGATRIAVPTGLTNAILVEPIALQRQILLKRLSGGSCEIIGVGQFATLSGAQLATLSQGGYVIPDTDFTIPGPARFYLSALGATSVIMALFEKGATAPEPTV